jgi:transposase
VLGDRGYDAEAIRGGLRDRHIVPWLAKRNTEHGSGLGGWRWVVERTFAWLNQFRRLRVRYEKRADIHEAFLALGCILICWRFLRLKLPSNFRHAWIANVEKSPGASFQATKRMSDPSASSYPVDSR